MRQNVLTCTSYNPPHGYSRLMFGLIDGALFNLWLGSGGMSLLTNLNMVYDLQLNFVAG